MFFIQKKIFILVVILSLGLAFFVVYAEESPITVITSTTATDEMLLEVNNTETFNLYPDTTTIHSLSFNVSGQMFGIPLDLSTIQTIEIFLYDFTLYATNYSSPLATIDGHHLVKWTWTEGTETWQFEKGTSTLWNTTGYNDPGGNQGNLMTYEFMVNFTVSPMAKAENWHATAVVLYDDANAFLKESQTLTMNKVVQLSVSGSNFRFSDLNTNNSGILPQEGLGSITILSNTDWELWLRVDNLSALYSSDVNTNNDILTINNTFVYTYSDKVLSGSAIPNEIGRTLFLDIRLWWHPSMDLDTIYTTTLFYSLIGV